MLFPYREFKGRLGPYVPIVLLGSQNCETLALIDSGADRTVLPWSFAKELGLSPEAFEIVAGVGAKTSGFRTSVKLAIGYDPVRVIELPCIVVDQDVPILLGREGFFDNFDITFMQCHGAIMIVDAI